MSAADGRSANDSRRAAYLRAMGLTPWVKRGGEADSDRSVDVHAPAPASADDTAEVVSAAATARAVAAEAAGQDPGTGAASSSVGGESAAATRGEVEPEAKDWEGLAAEIAGCTACALHQGRTHTVPGVGDTGSDWLVVGEAPGAEEDRQGEPFVGRAGKLLDNILATMGVSRSQGCYITNIVKCRPPRNRDPRPEEAAACAGYLERQIAWLTPKIILAVGRVAAQNLLDTEQPVGRLRGRVHRYRDTEIPLVVTYHPAYLLRSPAQKRRVWEDLKLARDVLAGRA